jgi:myo-inositol-1(or 4)-monophosphatase
VRDLVTDTDLAAQAAILRLIRDHYPDHGFLGEESAGPEPDDGVWRAGPGITWVVDPVDGTTNFTLGVPMICVSIGVVVDGVPLVGAVYDPLRDEMFSGGRELAVSLNGEKQPALQSKALEESVIGVDWAHDPQLRQQVVDTVQTLSRRCRTVRSLGAAALGLAYVAAGRLQVYANYGLKPWDTAAGAALIAEVGGDIRRPDGEEWTFGEPWVIAGPPVLLDEVIKTLKN